MTEKDAKDHEIDLDEVYRLVEVATKTMHFPKLAPIHAAAMKALEGHAKALLPGDEPKPEPKVEDQGQDIKPPKPGAEEPTEGQPWYQPKAQAEPATDRRF